MRIWSEYMEDNPQKQVERELLPVLIFSKKIQIRRSSLNGYGVFAVTKISKDEILEQSPFVLSGIRTKDLVQQNVRKFLWPLPCNCDECKYRGRVFAISSGFIQLYNHSENPSVGIQFNTKNRLVTVTTLKDIKKDEEILINYGKQYKNFGDF